MTAATIDPTTGYVQRPGRRPMTDDDDRHGSPAGYVAGCRRPCCRAPRYRTEKARSVDRLRGVPSTYSADEVTDLLARWDALGIPRTTLAEAVGCHSNHAVTGDRRVTAHTYRALARLTEDDIPDRAWVYADLTRTRIGSLMAAGHLLEDLPINGTGRWRYGTCVTVGVARTVRTAFRELAFTVGTSSQTRARSRNQGHLPPLAWDDPDTLAWPLRSVCELQPTQQLGRDFVDEAVVLRLADGRPVPNATRAEKVAAMELWTSRGGAQNELCRIHGWNEGRYTPSQREAS